MDWTVFYYLSCSELFPSVLNIAVLLAMFAFCCTQEYTLQPHSIQFEMFQTEDSPIIILLRRGQAYNRSHFEFNFKFFTTLYSTRKGATVIC
jgi:hypothetical protein